MLNKYLEEERSAFVISFNDYERLPLLDETDKILELLTNKYKESTMDIPPYHYAIINETVVQIKDTELAHTDTEYLAPFRNDIRILVVNSNIENIEDSIAEIIATASIKYCMKISGNVILDTDEHVLLSRLQNIVKKSILKRNEINPKFIIIEDVILDRLVVSEDIAIVSNRKSLITLRNFSEKYMVDLDILKDINPDVNPDKLYVGDHIFIPNTNAFKSVRIVLNAVKMAHYLTEKTIRIIGKVAENE